jgi:N utilization substance protein B
MENEPGVDAEKDFLIKVYSEFIAVSEDLYQCLEEQSIYWNDDMELVISDIIKTIKRSNPGKLLLPSGNGVFKNSEDREFALNLFRKTVLHHEKNKALIENQVENWDVDRIALMDILVMELAITEMVVFPEIPVKVTLNEYIELSKWYSSNKSGNFINGILDKITFKLKESKEIVKRGKGLVGEV